MTNWLYHAKVRDHFCPGDVELQQVGTMGPDLVEEHVVGDVPFKSQLRQARSVNWKIHIMDERKFNSLFTPSYT